jgi:transglutaminase-like putative cysteine protease
MKQIPRQNEISHHHWDWYMAILLVALVCTSAGRLSVTNWTLELRYVEPMAVLGAILGLALGFSHFDRRITRWLVFEYSLVFLPLQIMRIVTGEMPVMEQLYSAGGRLLYSFDLFFRGKPIEDPIFFVTLMSILFWAIGIYSGQRLMRDGGLLGILVPPTVPLLVVQYYDGFRADRLWVIAFYFFLVLLLVGRINLLRNQKNWQGRRVFTGSEPGFDLTNGMLITAAALVIVAWSFPTPAAVLPVVAHFWQRVNEPFQTTRERIGDMLAALHGPTRVSGELYGSTLALGTEASQGDGEMFSAAPPTFDYPRYYWRVRVYDTFTDEQWGVSASTSETFSPDQPNLPAESAFGQTGDFYFNWKTNRTTLFVVPSQPVWVSRSSRIQFAGQDKTQADVLSWRPETPIQPGEQYEARALLINPTLVALRNAGENYPEWIKERYLQIPNDLSAEVRNLANNLTLDKETPYDKAESITDYLHNQITYSLTIPSPPPGVSSMDWFLFIWKKGYCNYYATAEVLMLRSAGIPARMAVGYAQGSFKNGAFSVRARDSHAWPEVYFPGIGWVEFEPTSSQNPIVRADGVPGESEGELPSSYQQHPDNHALEEPNSPSTGGASNTPNSINLMVQRIGWWVIISLAVAALGFGIWRINRVRPLAQSIPQFVRRQYQLRGMTPPRWVEHWVRWSELTSVERSFHAVNQSLTWLGKPQPPHITSKERAELLKALMPSLAKDVDLLTVQHEQTLFSRTPGDPLKAAQVAWRIRYATLRSIVRRWFV